MEKIYKYKSEFSASYIKQNMPSLVKQFSETEKREFLYRDESDDTIWLGLEKGDHSGFWFIGSLKETSDGTIIEGSIVYNPDNPDVYVSKSRLSKVCTWILTAIMAVILCIPILIFWIAELIRGRKTKEEYLGIFLRKYLSCEKITGAD